MNNHEFFKENLGLLVGEVKTILQTITEVLEKKSTLHSMRMFASENQNDKLILAQVKKCDIGKIVEQIFGQRIVKTGL